MSLEQKADRQTEEASATFDRKIVIFLDSWDSCSTSEHVEAIADAFPRWDISVLQQFPRRKLSNRLRRKYQRFLREPVSVASQTIRALANWGIPSRRRSGRSVIPFAGPAEIVRPNIKYRSFSSLNGSEAIEYVQSLKPWLGISVGAPILKKKLFAIPELGTVNIHKSLLPNYRGMPYGFWELQDGAIMSGVSIHWVDEGLDTGPLICQRSLPIPPYSSVRGLAAELDVTGTQVLVEALRLIESQGSRVTAEAPESAHTGNVNSTPSGKVAQSLKKRLAQKRSQSPRGIGHLRAIARTVLLFLYVHVFARVLNLTHSLLGQCRTSILLYHRVSDAYLDTVTIGVEQFERQLEMLAQKYDVIDLPEFLASRGKPRKRPAVVLTFDDGYLDNYLAATLLRRIQLPCTFFVSTRIVDTDLAFPHDLKALGHAVPTITWDQIRQIRDWKFQISNHTQTHVDLGSVPLDTGLTEVAGAREDLQRELGSIPGLEWLAYPYGQPRHITNELRERLPQLGVPYCFSSYGGTNAINFAPLNLLRQGVDHRMSLLTLRAAIEGWIG